MTQLGKSPFDDASGQQLLDFLAINGVVSTTIHSYTSAGTTISDATPTTFGTVNVTSSAAATGITLSNNTPLGSSVLVFVSGANTVKVYPPDATQSIDGAGGGAPVTVASLAFKILTRISATTWIVSGTV